jgi:hypothetical protein
VNKYLILLRARGMQRGVLGSNRAWLGVWVGLTAVKVLGRMLQQPGAVERIELRPGQAVEIRDTGVKWADVPKQTKKKR